MNCINIKELEQFLKGKLASERLIAVDSHVRECSECRAVLNGMPERKQAGAELCASLLGVSDCPEYEELSAFVDSALEPDAARAVQIHANMCKHCASDIAAMHELRSHALLVDKVTVYPRASRVRAANPLVIWKRALAAASIAAVALAVALNVGPFGGAPKTGSRIAVNHPPTLHKPGIAKPATTKPEPIKPGNIAVRPATPSKTPAAPAYTVALRDGSYRVIEKNGKLLLAKADGQSVMRSLGSKLAASVDEKLRTGKTKPVGPIVTAITAIAVRGGSVYTPPPSAPKLIMPVGKVTLSDRPTFKWTSVDLADSYKLTITNEQGNIVVEETTNGGSLTLAHPLRRGQVYAWRVGSKFAESDSWAESAAGKFHVLSADDCASIQQVKRALPGSHLALGAAYERLGLTDEAANEYRALRRQNPDSELAKELLHKALLK